MLSVIQNTAVTLIQNNMISPYIFLIIFHWKLYFFVCVKMKEDKTTDISPHSETQNQTKGKRDKPKLYSSEEECIWVNSERQKKRSGEKTKSKRELPKEGRWTQSEVIKLLETKICKKDYTDWLIKETPKYMEWDHERVRIATRARWYMF